MRSGTGRLLGWLSGDGLSVLVLLSVLATVGLVVLVYCGWSSNLERLRNLAFVVFGVIGLPLAIWRSKVAHEQVQASNRQVQTSERSLLNERYQKGVEMLGSDTLFSRLGGIYALEQLAREHPEEYHIQVMNLFVEFLRSLPKSTKEAPINTGYEVAPESREVYRPQASPDIQAVVSAIGLRSDQQIEAEGREEWRINLDEANLLGVSLRGNFRGASLNSTNLSWTNLKEVDFTALEGYKTDIYNANLSGADLWHVKGLSQAALDGAWIWENQAQPNIHASYCVETGELLVWQGGTRPM